MYKLLFNPDEKTHIVVLEYLCTSFVALPFIELVPVNSKVMILLDNDKVLAENTYKVIETFSDDQPIKKAALDDVPDNIQDYIKSTYTAPGKSALDILQEEQQKDTLENKLPYD